VSREVIIQHVSAAIFKIMGTTYWGHELDLVREHDHSNNNMLFPIVSHFNRVSILSRFRDICIEICRGNDLDLSGYVTPPVT